MAPKRGPGFDLEAEFEDYCLEDGVKSAKHYAGYMNMAAARLGQRIGPDLLRSQADVRPILVAISKTDTQKGTLDDIASVLRKYARMVWSRRAALGSGSTNQPTDSPAFESHIEHQDLYEDYLRARGVTSIVQYISSLDRASRLLSKEISPTLLPAVNAVDKLVAELQRITKKKELFGPVGTALRRYAEMVAEDFRGQFGTRQIEPASDVPLDELPPRLKMEVSRLVRDTKLARKVKALHDDRCQLCGIRLELWPGRVYSEAHHLKALGKPHNGPDKKTNIVCVCPNCHAMLDYFAKPIVPGQLRLVTGHEVGKEFIDYHNDQCAKR